MIMDLFGTEKWYVVYFCVNCVYINGLDGVELASIFRLLESVGIYKENNSIHTTNKQIYKILRIFMAILLF